jgi:cell division septum initiation protein DivIVA
MKPAAAFSVGLWTGAAVVAAVGVFYVQGIDRVRSSVSPAANSELSASLEQIRQLEQENARLSAELQRFRETASVLKSNLDVQTTEAQPRRVPFLRPSPPVEAAPSESAQVDWIEQAIVSGDVDELPQLEEAALKNNHRALEALALLADQDQAAALTRVWRSQSLTPSNQVDATRYLAATMEVNPNAEQLLRGLASDSNADVRALSAAVDGLANPGFPTSFAQDPLVPAPPHFRPDFSARVRLLDGLRAVVADEGFRAHADQARTELQAHWAESNPASP